MYRQKSVWKRVIYGMLATVMLLTSCNWGTILAAARALGQSATYQVSFGTVTAGGETLTPEKNGEDGKDGSFYMVPKSQQILLTANLQPDFTTGYIKGQTLELNLPYLYLSESGILVQVNSVDEIPAEKRLTGEYLGLQAKVNDKNSFGESTEVYDASGAKLQESDFARGKIELRNPYEKLSGTCTPRFEVEFYAANPELIAVPENASVTVTMKFSYQGYYGDSGQQLGNEWSTDELDESSAAQRRVTFVNSNLIWQTSIENVPTVQLKKDDATKTSAVMWQQYNYMVYEVTVENDSTEKESTIDNYLLTVQAQYNPNRMKSVLDEDILRWTSDAPDTPNENVSQEFYQEHEFIGKPNEGGVLVYDVTEIPDWKTEWDLEHFTNVPSDSLPYSYSGVGNIILRKEATDQSHMLYSKEKAEELNQNSTGKTYYAAHKYMVAIPYSNNFHSGVGYDNRTQLTTTITFGGGSSIHWSEQAENTTNFTPPTRDNFRHHKYVKDADGNEVTEKTVGIGAVDEYYLDGFHSIGNVPVFNAISTDYVPDDFGLQEIFIRLDNDEVYYPDIQLSDWFKVEGNDIDQFIRFGFTAETGETVYKTAKELGLHLEEVPDTENTEPDSKTWKLSIGTALSDQAGLTFCQEVQFLFREELPRYTDFNGLITMRGAFPHLWTYENKIDTNYELHYYQPKNASIEDGSWLSEPLTVSENTAVIRTEKANPVLEGVGVYDDPIGGLVQKGNPQVVSLNDDTAAARFVISNDSVSQIIPATLEITNLYPDDNYSAGGLVASKILLSKSLMEKSKIQSVVLHGKNAAGKAVDVSLEDLSSYGTDADGNLELPKAVWSNLTYLSGMTIHFDRIDGNITMTDNTDDTNCFVQINGKPTTEQDLTPHGVLETAYSFDDHDLSAEDQSVDATVTLQVSKVLPNLLASVHAVRKDGTTASSTQYSVTDRNGTHIVYPSLSVPNKSAVDQTWYQFTLTNNSRSTSSHALLQVDMDSVENEPIDCLQDIEGFDTRKIVLEGIGSGRAAEIEEIQLFDWDNTTYTATTASEIVPDQTVSADDLTVDANGVVTFSVPDTIQRLRSVRIIFSRIYGNQDLEHLKELNLKLYGSTDWTGSLKASAKFEVIGSINAESKTASEATMQVASTNLQITPSVHRLETDESSASSLTVPNKANNLYYNFLLENKDTDSCYSKAGRSTISVDLESVGVKTEKDGQKIVKGFLSDRVTISKNYAESGTIESIVLTAFLPDGVVGPAQSKQFSLAELEAHPNANGDLEIDVSDWAKNGLYLSHIELVYANLERDLSAEQGNAPELRIYGTSDWFDDLTATCTVTPQHALMENQKKSASVKFHVDRPALSVNTHIFYNDQQESVRTKKENTDGNETIFGVPYDRDFMLRGEFANETISILDDTQIVMQIPYEKQGEAGTGFHTTELRIYQDLINQFGSFDNIILTGKDADNQEKSVTLLPQLDESGAVTGFYLEGDTDKTYSYTDGALTFTRDTETRLFEFGIEHLTQVELNGRLVQLVNQSAVEKRYIECDGYDDSLFGKTDTLEVETHNYLDGFRESKGYETASYDQEKYIVTAKDTTAIYLSKMYFDTTVMAFYKDSTAEADQKYSAASSSLEHIRKQYAQPTENKDSDGHVHGATGYLFSEQSQWGDNADNSELEIGYKSIGSFAVDFRQYLNTGSNLPHAKPAYAGQEHQSYDYVRNASLNTAATVDLTLDLPVESFDAYYLKIDPRAKEYIRSVTAIYQDGTKRTRSGKEILYEANETNADGAFARLNLLGGEEDVFSSDDTYYYKKPESYQGQQPANPVKQVIVTIDINRYQTVNNDGKTAASPNYGIWYDQTDSSTQGMFEVTGRFYRMEEAVATAHADVTVGNTTNNRSKERVESGETTKESNWSFGNSYYGWSPQHSYSHGYYWTYSINSYTAQHLQSSTKVHIVNDQDNVLKGVGETPSTSTNRKAEFGNDNSYAISFYRQGRTITVPASYVYWSNSRTAPNNNEYHWSMASPYVRTDQYDWVKKLSFTDRVVLSDTLPETKPDDTYDYKGFLTTGIQIKKEIYQYFQDQDQITFTLNAKNTDGEILGTAQVVSVPVAELKELYGETEDWNISFTYTPKPKDTTESDDTDAAENAADPTPDAPQVEPTYTIQKENGSYVIALGVDTFVTDYSMTLYNIPGTGDYSAELTDKEQADAHNSNTWDILVHGKPYAIDQKDDDKYGTNIAKTSVSTDYAPDQEIYSNTDNAILMGYLINFKAGYELLTRSGRTSENLYYDYKTDNNTPNPGLYQVKLYNQNRNNAEGQEAAARIETASTVNTMDSRYRLQHIYLSAFLLDGDWFEVAQLVLQVGSTQLPVRVVHGTGVDNLVDDTYITYVDQTETVSGEAVYSIDVENILRQMYKRTDTFLPTYTNGTNQKPYVKAYVDSFQLDFQAKHPDRIRTETVLGDGQYLSADQTKNTCTFLYDGIYADRTAEDFVANEWNADSTPSFGKSPNSYAEQTATNNLSATFTSIDPNADIYTYTNVDGTAKGSTKKTSYAIKNLTGILDVTVSRTKMYDLDSKTGNIDSVDYLHLSPYDYVAYTVAVGADKNALIPLEHTTVDFTVPAGQRIVRWDVVDADGTVQTTGNASENIPVADISATLSDGAATLAAAQGVKYALLASEETDPEETSYQRLVAELGQGTNHDDQIAPGETIYIRVVTQLTENNGSYDDVTVGTANVKVYAAPKHTYPQYAIYNTTGSGNYQPNNSNTYATRTTDLAGYTYYYRYTKADEAGQVQYYAHTQNTLQYQSTAPVTLTYQSDNLKQNYDGKGASLTIRDLYQETGHFCDTYSVEVSFLEKQEKETGIHYYRGFELTEPYTVPDESADKYQKVELLYAVAEPSTDPRFAEDENIAFQQDDTGALKLTWKSYTYTAGAADQQATAKMTDTDLPNVVGVRWVYYDLNGFDTKTQFSSTSKTKVTLENVKLTGVGRYQDLTDGTAKKADTYTQHFTAVNTYTHVHSEDEYAVTVDASGNSTVAKTATATAHSIQTSDKRELTHAIYRENPIATFHTQTFETQAAANATYNEAAVQKTGYRPGDVIWQKVTLQNNLAALKNNAQAGEEGRLINPVFYDKLPEYFAASAYDSYQVGDGISDFGLRILHADGTEQSLQNIELYLANKTTDMTGYDYGGKMAYTDGYKTGNSSQKAFADLKLTENNTAQIQFTVYELRLRYKDDPAKDFVLQSGEQVEFCYSATIRKEDLPMVYTTSTYEEDATESTMDSDGLHSAYFPRIGEYY